MNASRSNPLWYLLLLLGAVVMLFPLWWMTVVSLMSETQAKQSMGSGELLPVPRSLELGNYADAMREVGTEPWSGFLDALANSIVVTVLVVLGTILSSSMVATAFARIRFRGRSGLFLIMLASMMLPAQVTMIPLLFT